MSIRSAIIFVRGVTPLFQNNPKTVGSKGAGNKKASPKGGL
jgi:hypothetical protein